MYLNLPALHVRLSFFSVPLEGKDAACNTSAVSILSQLLVDESSSVRSNAAGALMA